MSDEPENCPLGQDPKCPRKSSRRSTGRKNQTQNTRRKELADLGIHQINVEADAMTAEVIREIARRTRKKEYLGKVLLDLAKQHCPEYFFRRGKNREEISEEEKLIELARWVRGLRGWRKMLVRFAL